MKEKIKIYIWYQKDIEVKRKELGKTVKILQDPFLLLNFLGFI